MDLDKSLKNTKMKNLISRLTNEYLEKIRKYGIRYLVVYTLYIIFYSFIIYYLVNLKKCLCFQEENKENYSNINYLIIFESLGLILCIISFIGISILLYSINSKQKGGMQNIVSITKYIIIFCIVIIFIISIIQFYFMYNVKKLEENIKKDCDCSHNWIRYLLYIQTIIVLFSFIIFIIVGIIILFSIFN